jgi:hypothetical protein
MSVYERRMASYDKNILNNEPTFESRYQRRQNIEEAIKKEDSISKPKVLVLIKPTNTKTK